MSLAPCIETAWQFAALILVQSTLLIVGAYLTVKLLRLRDAALQSVIYRSALLATLVAPLATFVMMRSEIVGWWPKNWNGNSLSLNRSPESVAGANRLPPTLLASSIELDSIAPQAIAESFSSTVLPSPEPQKVVAQTTLSPDFVYSAKLIFCVVWASISALLLSRLWRAHRQLCRALSKAVPVEPPIQAFCDQLAAKLQVPSPRVVCSPYFSSPFLAGVLHPVVHLPSDGFDDFDPSQAAGLREILIHELAHLKRRDIWIRMLNQFVMAIFFFQPLLWRLAKWLESSAEDVCDDYVMSFGARRDRYAGRLVDLADRCDFPIGSAVGIASGKSALQHRVVRIMDASRRLSTRVSRAILAVCSLATVAAITTVCLLMTPARDTAIAQDGKSDLDLQFEKLTDLDSTVYQEEREGLIFAIHQAKRFENGGVMIMSTVRGTDETLEQFPLTHRRMGPNQFITDGPATNYQASPQGSSYFRLTLAGASYQGVHAQWWMLVPRGQMPTWFEDKEGKVQLEIGITPQGEYGRANHTDENGVMHHIYWKLPLDIAKPSQLPTLDQIAASVHEDLSNLTAMTFRGKLHMGVEDIGGTPTSQFGSASNVSVKEYAKATLEHWQWWEKNDVDFQIKSGATSDRSELGGGSRPAVMVDYLSVVDDKTLARAAQRSELSVISARGVNITDEGLAHLKALNRLKRLDLANTSITDSGLRHLEAIKSLKRVNLADTKVTQAGIERLRQSIPNLVVVTDNSHSNTPKKSNVPDNKTQQLPPSVTGMVIDSEDQPISNAKVTVLIRTFAKEMHEELKGTQAWTAVTDDKGRYSFAPKGTIHSSNEVRVKVVAEGFADVSDRDYEKIILSGVLPSVRMHEGRRINGRLVGENGEGIAKAIVRFQSCNEDLSLIWDSGPFPVDSDGRFSLTIPADGKATGVIYPTGYAPQFLDVATHVDQGDIVLEKGVAMKGRVVDKNGQGVANTVVGIRKTERRIMYSYVALIGTAVKTDDSGNFQLPALSGAYELTVDAAVPDYSRQMVLNGKKPPKIDPMTVDFEKSEMTEAILLEEKAP